MFRYPAFVDGEAGAYGMTFPDLPGIVAIGETVEDALANAEEAPRDYVTETEGDGRVAEVRPPCRAKSATSHRIHARVSANRAARLAMRQPHAKPPRGRR